MIYVSGKCLVEYPHDMITQDSMLYDSEILRDFNSVRISNTTHFDSIESKSFLLFLFPYSPLDSAERKKTVGLVRS